VNPELRRAVEAYRKGLSETRRLIEDVRAPYGTGLVAETAIPYLDTVVDVLICAYGSLSAIDHEALAEAFRGLQPSGGDGEGDSGTRHNYLHVILGKLLLHSGGAGLAASPAPDPALGQWVDELLIGAAYHREEVDRAWYTCLSRLVDQVEETAAEHGELGRQAVVPWLMAGLCTMPDDVLRRIVDSGLQDRLDAAVE